MARRKTNQTNTSFLGAARRLGIGNSWVFKGSRKKKIEKERKHRRLFLVGKLEVCAEQKKTSTSSSQNLACKCKKEGNFEWSGVPGSGRV